MMAVSLIICKEKNKTLTFVPKDVGWWYRKNRFRKPVFLRRYIIVKIYFIIGIESVDLLW